LTLAIAASAIIFFCAAVIPLNLLKARVPSHSCDLMRTRTAFGECRGARLAQAVSSLIAASAEPIAEATWGEWAAELTSILERIPVM